MAQSHEAWLAETVQTSTKKLLHQRRPAPPAAPRHIRRGPGTGSAAAARRHEARQAAAARQRARAAENAENTAPENNRPGKLSRGHLRRGRASKPDSRRATGVSARFASTYFHSGGDDADDDVPLFQHPLLPN